MEECGVQKSANESKQRERRQDLQDILTDPRQHTNVRIRIQRSLASFQRNLSDQEDAAQEAFLRAYTHRDQFIGNSSPLTWLTRIATNFVRDTSRKASAKRRLHVQPLSQEELESIPDQGPISTDAVELGEATDRIRNILQGLSKKRHAVALSLLLQNFSLEEIVNHPAYRKAFRESGAKNPAPNKQSVKKDLHYGRRALSKILQEQGIVVPAFHERDA